MKKLSFLLFGALAALLTSSCVVYGLTSGRNKLPKSYLGKVIDTDADIAKLPCDGNIYVTKVQNIKDFLASNDSVAIFEWVAGCPHYCVTPALFENYCTRHNYRPLIIIGHFSGIGTFQLYDAKTVPLIFPDYPNEYDSNLCWKYMDKFRKDMVGDKENYYDWLFFRGKFIRNIDPANEE